MVFQRLFKGWPNTSDTAHLTRTTIFIPRNLVSKGKIEITDKSGVLAFISDGLPSFRDFCIAYAIKGFIEYTSYSSTYHENDPGEKIFFKNLKIDYGLRASISLTIALVDLSGSKRALCSNCEFNADLVFTPGNLIAINGRLADSRSNPP